VVSNTPFQQETSSLLLKASYRRMYYFRGYFMLKNGTRTSIKTIFIDCQSIPPDSSFYLLRIAATSALLRKVTIRLAPQCRSSCNWRSYRAQKHEIIERINEALGTSARIEHDATDDAEFLIWEAESNKVLIVKNRAQYGDGAGHEAHD
jgi:hypothetical protein